MDVLAVDSLTVNLGGRAILEDISLRVAAGEMVAVIGPNGAGKSTLIRAILGMIPFSAGRVLIFGKTLGELGPAREHLGYVPQQLELDRSIPVTVAELIGINTPRRFKNRDAIMAALAEVDAAHLERRHAGQLSGGELQRVLIAMNLLRDPRILFLDEPASGVDIEGERRFYDVIEQLRERRKLAVVMISHDVSVVYRYATRVVCINRRLMCQGLPGEVLTDQNLEQLYGHATALYHHHG